ncbi:MAG: DUF3536 domain-containing protein [Deltaproteobacteria bacterium]|nr:DUF3536 domain-containing protein [Deltaproteobacteria bacterium]
MTRYLCIHGHFYQPPRHDPWLEEVLPEGSAAPYHNWNERICRECYAPLGHARRMEGGEISAILNCYEWMSFNFGPTLLSWMDRHAPDVYECILAGDRESLARLGHGNAMAQCYHHVIMPLASEWDKALEVEWAVQDFQFRYDRDPEGMWLPEAAVDTSSLECLARAGIRYVVLAPRQARQVGSLDGGKLADVDEGNLDTTVPYLVTLPSGRTISVFFYHGALSRSVAFERLLEDGARFWERLQAGYCEGLRSIATDGESYGHHFMFGEMALAFVIEKAVQDPTFQLTNYAAFLNDHPPRCSVVLHEPSSWSCIHGIERWRSDCGCADGGHPDWNQQWRGPLRRGLNVLRHGAGRHYRKAGESLFLDPESALRSFGRVLSGEWDFDQFFSGQVRPDLDLDTLDRAVDLLQMERWALSMFASCAWFFDDIGRIEPEKAMLAAKRVIELMKATGGPDLESDVLEHFVQALSNDPAKGTALDLWSGPVRRATANDEVLAVLAVMLDMDDTATIRGVIAWPGLGARVERRDAANARINVILRSRFKTATRTVEVEPRGPGIPDEVFLPASGRHIRWRDLEGRKRLLICSRLARAVQKQASSCLMGRTLDVSAIFPSYTEGQRTPVGDYGLLVPNLALTWALGGDVEVERDFLAYVGEGLRREPILLAMFVEEVIKRAGQFLDDGDFDGLAGFLTRVNRIGVSVDWWSLQNRVWRLGAHNLIHVGHALGFQVPSASHP